MKGLRLVCLLVLLCLGLTACGRESMDTIIATKPNVTGIVTRVGEQSMLIRAEDGTEYQVSLQVENQDSVTHFTEGDEIVVYYNGEVAESWPLQILTVYAITLQTPASREDLP